jgi:pimeloyl-ACP methyl ester carboxylesterase
MRRREVLIGLAAVGGAALAGGAAAARAFSHDMAYARARLVGRSALAHSRFGALEFAVEGTGPPVLMSHGTGGGFDQGVAMAAPLVRSGWQLIAPSRFGYLRSDLPPNPSSENQADSFVDLLDRLGIERAAIIGGSAGALPALHFAHRHADRCRALIALVPVAHVRGRAPIEPPHALARAIITYALRSDFLFWAGMKTNPDAMIGALLATDPALVARADAEERRRVHTILRDLLPVSARARGLMNDAEKSYRPAPLALEEIRVPTLAISFRDDRFDTAAAAREIGMRVPGARFSIFESGGHVWVGHEREVFSAIDAFLRNAPP